MTAAPAEAEAPEVPDVPEAPEAETDPAVRLPVPAGMTLLDLEAFCASLRAAGGAGDCPVYVKESLCRPVALTAWPDRHAAGLTPVDVLTSRGDVAPLWR